MRHDLVLEGEGVRLSPPVLADLAALTACANDPALWEFTFQPNPFASDTGAQRWFDYAVDSPGVQAFTIFDKRSGEVAGSTRYLEIDDTNRKLEIGWTFHARRFWRTHVNTEAKFLLLRHAFETLHCVRVQFKAEAVNARSHAAILRLGAAHEGTLRNFRIRANGELRDTNFYSIIESEWPQVKEQLTALMREGRSLYSLSAE